MQLDNELYRKAYESYRLWDEDESIQRLLDARELTPEQAWQRYVALWNFVMKNGLIVSETFHRQKLIELQPYFDALQKLNNRD
jgi:hypothetical protein